MIYIDDEVYDGIIMKPDLGDALEHYGVKGMKWKKRRKNRSIREETIERNKKYPNRDKEAYNERNRAFERKQKIDKIRKKHEGYPEGAGQKRIYLFKKTLDPYKKSNQSTNRAVEQLWRKQKKKK